MTHYQRAIQQMTICAATFTASIVLVMSTAQCREKQFREGLQIDKGPPDRSGPLGGYSSIVDKVSHGLVSIYTEKRLGPKEGRSFRPFFEDPFFKRFFGDDFEFYQYPDGDNSNEDRSTPPRFGPKERGLGSGVVLSGDGYIVTNNHVVAGADDIKVRFPDGSRDYHARVVGRDPSTDVAVLKVDGAKKAPVILGDSGELKVGDVVLAIGNPFGLRQTVTAGIVSALGRKNLDIASYENFIQTDASINPGNSGGALIDNQGRVVGINTAIVPRIGIGGNVGIGFAIPINMAVEVAERLIEDGEIRRGFLGVLLSDLSEELAEGFGTNREGVLVNEVMSGTPAEKSGMKAGDIIIKFDGKKVDDMAQLRLLVAGTQPGSKVKVVIRRDGQEEFLTVEIGRLGEAESRAEGGPAPTGEFLPGVEIETLTGELRKRFDLDPDVEGVLVAEVESNSPAGEAGLRAGHVIVEVSRQPVSSVEEAMKARDRSESADVVLLYVVTPQGARYIAVRKEDHEQGR